MSRYSEQTILSHLLDLKGEVGEVKSSLDNHEVRLKSIEGEQAEQTVMLKTISEAPIYQLNKAIGKELQKYGGVLGIVVLLVVSFVIL